MDLKQWEKFNDGEKKFIIIACIISALIGALFKSLIIIVLIMCGITYWAVLKVNKQRDKHEKYSE